LDLSLSSESGIELEAQITPTGFKNVLLPAIFDPLTMYGNMGIRGELQYQVRKQMKRQVVIGNSICSPKMPASYAVTLPENEAAGGCFVSVWQ
jgi:hypothetical protein